jgi:hypothetical protein
MVLGKYWARETAIQASRLRESEVPSPYFTSHFDDTLLANTVDVNSLYTFLPLIGQNTEGREALPVARHEQNSIPASSISSFLESPNANMVGKKSGRALQLEEGTRN